MRIPRRSPSFVRTSRRTTRISSRRMRGTPARSCGKSLRSTASSWTSRTWRSTSWRTPFGRFTTEERSTSIESWSGRRRGRPSSESARSHGGVATARWTCGFTGSERIRRPNTTSASTSRSIEGDPPLSLIRPGPLLVRLRGRGLESHEYDLSEPVSDGQLEWVGAPVPRAERQGAGEPRIDHPERGDDPTTRPRRPEPDLARHGAAESDGFPRADRESGRRRDLGDASARPHVRGGDENLLDRNVVPVRREVRLVVRRDLDLALGKVLADVRVRENGHRPSIRATGIKRYENQH